PVEKITSRSEGGGLRPLMRAENIVECARLFARFGAPLDKKILRKYPGAGESLADTILLFARTWPPRSPDSNALRVLLRLGYGTEAGSYAASYKSAVAAAGEMPNAMEAH